MTQEEIQQKAYEVYPLDLDRHFIIEGEPYDNNKEKREAYIRGLTDSKPSLPSEKDLALTIDDIERLHTFLYAVKNNKQGAFTFTRLSDEQYEEVLKRFNNSWK